MTNIMYNVADYHDIIGTLPKLPTPQPRYLNEEHRRQAERKTRFDEQKQADKVRYHAINKPFRLADGRIVVAKLIGDGTGEQSHGSPCASCVFFEAKPVIGTECNPRRAAYPCSADRRIDRLSVKYINAYPSIGVVNGVKKRKSPRGVGGAER